MYGEMVSELVRYRGLLGMLAWRDIRVRYKQSLLGVAWAFLMPVIQTAVLVAIFKYSGVFHINPVDTDYMPYLLFVLSGIIPWTLFNATLASSVESLTRNSRLVTKIYFPREVFPLATVAGSLVDLLIAQSVFIPVYLYYVFSTPGVFIDQMGNHIPYHAAHLTAKLLFLPVVLLVQVLLVSGLSLIISMGNLFFRDVKYIMTFVLQMWFFATNVAYPLRFMEHPWMRWVACANPMIAILNAYRDCLMGQAFHEGTALSLGVAATLAVAVFLLGWRMFHKAEFKFAEYV